MRRTKFWNAQNHDFLRILSQLVVCLHGLPPQFLIRVEYHPCKSAIATPGLLYDKILDPVLSSYIYCLRAFSKRIRSHSQLDLRALQLNVSLPLTYTHLNFVQEITHPTPLYTAFSIVGQSWLRSTACYSSTLSLNLSHYSDSFVLCLNLSHYPDCISLNTCSLQRL